MNARGQYGVGRGGRSLGPRGRGRSTLSVGSQLQHVLELSQRYDGVNAAGAQALLNGLSADGVISASGPNRWEVALRDGAWVRLAWDSGTSVLQVTITDKQPHPIDQVHWIRNSFEKILRDKIAPRLVSYGAVAVGITLYHSVGDRLAAVKQMDLDWTALFQDLAVQAGELTRDTSPSGVHYTSQAEFDALKPDPKKVSWWKTFAKPRFAEWTKFRREQLGQDLTHGADYVAWTERFKTNWDEYEGWMTKLEALKGEAKRQGFTIGVPTATALPTTVWADAGGAVERGAGAVASAVGDTWKFVKYGAWAALGIGAIVAVSSVASNLKSGKDPGEKYMDLIRQSRRPRVPRTPRARALPASEQLALAAGEE